MEVIFQGTLIFNDKELVQITCQVIKSWMQEWAFPIFVLCWQRLQKCNTKYITKYGDPPYMFLVGDHRRMETCPKWESQSPSNKHRAGKQTEPCTEFLLKRSDFASAVAPSHAHRQSYTLIYINKTAHLNPSPSKKVMHFLAAEGNCQDATAHQVWYNSDQNTAAPSRGVVS